MNKRIKQIIYYIVIIIMFLITDKVLYIIPSSNKNNVLNNTLMLENKDLKKELSELSKLNYNDYDYELGKITFKKVYNNNSYFIEYSGNYDNNVVLNNIGMIGIVNNHILTLTKDLSLSVKIKDSYGILKNNKIEIVNGDYMVNDPIYTSGITSINDNYLIGYVENIHNDNIKNIIDIKYIDIDENYVVILK